MLKYKTARLSILLIIVFSIFSLNNATAQIKWSVLTTNGSWPGLSDPRAIFIPGDTSHVILGYVTEDGAIASMLFNTKTKHVQQALLQMGTKTENISNPAFVQLPDSSFMAFFQQTHTQNTILCRGKIVNKLLRWQSADTIYSNPGEKKITEEDHTELVPFLLSEEKNKLFLFKQTNNSTVTLTTSNDKGKTWSNSKSIFSNKKKGSKNEFIVKYFSDGKNKIHLVFSDSSNPVKPNNIYYAYYSNGAFYRVDGKKICTINQLPFDITKATCLYEAKKGKQAAFPADIVVDPKGTPAVAYVKNNESNQASYHYNWYDEKKWKDNLVGMVGSKMERTSPINGINFSGGITLSPSSEHTLYVSQKTGSAFEIEKRELNTAGNTWKTTVITSNSQSSNILPYTIKSVPGSEGTILLWIMKSNYPEGNSFKSAIKLFTDKK